MPQIRLNENQKKAVEYNKGDLLIIAGAGTGKTAVITQRIISIIKKDLAKEKLLEAIENIRERKFAATPGFGCNFCDYNSVCEFAEI